MKKINQNILNTLKTTLILSVLSSSTYVKAEDAEVFFSVNLAKPNLLFVLDNSGSMARNVSGGSSGTSRMDIMKGALKYVLEDDQINNVNIGLMRYGPGYNNRTFTNGGYDFYGEASTTNNNVRSHGIQGVTFPITDINALVTDVIPTESDTYFLPSLGDSDETVRDYFDRIIDSWEPSGGTPIVGSLYEAALYYRGEKMHYGQDNPNHTIHDNKQSAPIAAHPSSYLNDSQTSVIATNYLTGSPGSDNPVNPRNHAIAPYYNSPIKSHCQSNYIVIMSDGYPTYYESNLYYSGLNWSKAVSPLAEDMQGNSGYSELAENMPVCKDEDGNTSATPGRGSFRDNAGRCGPELTKFLAENDNSSAYEDKQVIKTFSIGFGDNMSSETEDYLKSLATFDDPDTEDGPGKDAYFSADSPLDLVISFRKILRRIGKPKDSLASPGYSVNVKSGLEHESDIYIPVFSRKETAMWSGNLKKFKLVDVDGKRLIQGKNNRNATDELGGFTDGALDYWSETSNSSNNPDGKAVEKGGAASLIDPDGRKVYSDISDSLNLYASSNHITADNFANLPVSVFGLEGIGHHGHGHYEEEDRRYKSKLANFIRGWKDGDENSTARKHMGDMLHSEPLVATYEDGQYIFAATNEGYLHAFDTTSGEEVFAFMPKELLKNIKIQFQNSGTQKDHKYGVDGSLTFWHDKINNKRYLYFGLRRGGSSFYALDVTNINRPKLAWTKSHDSGDKFSGMGESWSIPYLARIGTSNGEKEVVIFSGGYDTTGAGKGDDRNKSDGSLEVDDAKSTRTANVGNDVLILDAKYGYHIFSLTDAQRQKIKGSVPGGVRILDTNYNKLVDRIYFADTAGSIWRLDLSEKIGGYGDASKSKLTKMADFSNGSRKFYNEPDVAAMRLNGKTVYAILIGSGFRAHPLDKTIEDNFFIVLDKKPFNSLPDNYEPVKDVSGASKDLAVITISEDKSVSISTDDGVQESISDTDKWGWKINLPSTGEKVLATSITGDGIVKFTTLVPEVLTEGVGVDLCAAPPTQGRFYAIDVLSGHAGMDLNKDGVINDQDIYELVSKGEIPGKPQVVTNPLDVADVVDEDGNPTGEKSCKHPVDIRIGKKLSQATGYDTCRLESVYWSDPAAAK